MNLPHLWTQCAHLEHMLLFILWVMIVFGDPPENLHLYRTHQTGFYQHEDHFLIRGWSKHTESIHEYFDVDDIPEPIVAVVNLKHFKRPLIAIPDHESVTVGYSLWKENVGQMLLCYA